MNLYSARRRLAVAALVLCGGVGRAQSPLDAVPADAKIVVLVNNLERTMQGSEKFTQAIGQQAPPADLGQITQMMGPLGSQWRVNRGVAIAVMQPGQDGLVTAFPVDDASAALKAVDAELKGDLGAFDLFGQSVVGRPRGKHLLVSTSESTLKGVSAEGSLAAALTPAQAKLAETSAVFVYVNIQTLKPMIDQGFEGEQLKRVFERIAEQYPQIKPEQAAEGLKRAVMALSEQAKSLYLSFQIDESVALVRIGVELLPSSPARGKLANFKASGADLFGRLPASQFATAFSLDAAALASIGDAQEGPKVTGVSGALSLTSDTALAMFRVDSPDAAKINEQLRGLVGFGQMMAAGQAQGKVEFANNQKKVGGADVSEVVVKFKDAPDKAVRAIGGVLGGNDLIIQHGVVGQAVGVTIGGKADGFAALQTSGALSASGQVKEAIALLPGNSVFVFLIDPMSMLQLGQRIARAVGDETPIAGVNLDGKAGFPIAAGVSIEPDGLTINIAVASAALKNVAPILQKLD